MSQPAEIFGRDPVAIVDTLVRRGRTAMEAFAASDQARVDEAVTALGYTAGARTARPGSALCQPSRWQQVPLGLSHTQPCGVWLDPLPKGRTAPAA